MHVRYIFIGLCILSVLSSCSNQEHSENSDAAPEYIQHEELMTRNPKTGKVEREKLYKYLLSKRKTLGQNNRLDKRKVYPASWSNVDDFFASLAIQRMVYDPNNSQVMYFCTGEGWNNADAARGAGIWKTIDGGSTWNQLASTQSDTFWYCADLLIHPVTSDVYVATRSQGVLRSKDGGNSWEVVLNSLNGSIENQATDLDITADNELFVCIGNFSTDGIYFSTTGNVNDWEKRMTGIPNSTRRIVISTAQSNADVVYAIPTSSIRNDSNKIHGVYRSEDKGLTWTMTALPGGDRNLAKTQGWYDLIIKVSPEDENVVLVGGLNIFRTTDGGASWQQLCEGDRRKKSSLQYVHVDQHEIIFKTKDTVLFGNDGGIYRCDEILADTPFIYSINENYNVTQFYSCAIDASEGSTFVIGGTQDNGSLGSENDGITEFRQLSWADGSYCNIDHGDPDIFYTTTQYRRLYRNNHGKIDTITNGNIVNSNTLFINPIEMDPNDPNILYQLTNRGLWRLNNARTATKDDWQKASRNFGTFSAIGISKSNKNVVYLGRSSGGVLYRIDNANTTDENYLPVNCDPNGMLPDGYCRSIFVDPLDGNHVIATYSNYGLESVWESKNAMSDNATWVSHEGDLPDIPIRWAVLHPENSSVCYLATEAGVFMTTMLDGASTKWSEVNDGLANLKVNMLRVRANDLTLAAGTHGRGIYTGKIQSDYSVKWEERGPRNVGGRTRTMVFDPNDPTGKKLWAGSVSGGLWVVQNYDSVNTYYEIFDAFEIKLGPNPIANGRELTVFVTSEKNREIAITAYNVDGQKVLESKNLVDPGNTEIPLNTNDLSGAMYFFKIESDGYKEVFKVIVL